MSQAKKVSHIRIVIVAILDFFTVFFIAGYLIAKFTGDTTESGFQLNGAPALSAIGLIVVYFIAGKYLGGTLWQRILRTK